MNCRSLVLIALGSLGVVTLSDDAAWAKAPDCKKVVGTDTQPVKELVKKDLKKGKGKEAKSGQTVKAHYTGCLLDGSKFDSSLDRDRPIEFTLGSGQVIKGWDDGIMGMKEGGRRKLVIPADQAYGPEGRPPVIPPNATLVFEVELVKVGD